MIRLLSIFSTIILCPCPCKQTGKLDAMCQNWADTGPILAAPARYRPNSGIFNFIGVSVWNAHFFVIIDRSHHWFKKLLRHAISWKNEVKVQCLCAAYTFSLTTFWSACLHGLLCGSVNVLIIYSFPAENADEYIFLLFLDVNFLPVILLKLIPSAVIYQKSSLVQ